VINQFRANSPYNNFLTILYAGLILWPIYSKPLPCNFPADNEFLNWFFSFYTNTNIPSILFSIITFTLLICQTILLNRIASAYKLFTKQHHATGIAYLFSVSFFCYRLELTPELVSGTICLFILYKIPLLQNTSSPKSLLFNAGWMIGLATLIFPPAIFFILVVWIALVFTRPLRLAEWGMVFLGVMTPYYLLGSTMFLFDQSKEILLPAYTINKPEILFTKLSLSLCIFWSILILIGFFYVQQYMNKLLYQSRITWSIINIYAIISVLCIFLNNHNRMVNIFFIIAPMSLLGSAVFVYPGKKILVSILHWIILVASLCFNFVNFHI